MKLNSRLLAISVTVQIATVALAAPLDNWTVRNPVPTPNNLRAVTSGNGLLVAVGTAGTIVTSADGGETWVARESALTNLSINLIGVAYGNGQFVALPAPNLNNSILISTNGTNWSVNSGVFTNVSLSAFAGVAFGFRKFVALASGSGAVVATATSSGAREPQTNVISAAGNQGIIQINYDFLGVPDQMTHIFYNGTNIFDSGYVSGTGQFNVNFGPGLSTNVTVVMNQFTNPNPVTTWSYTATITGPGSSTTNAIMTSADGLTWFPQTHGIKDPFTAVTFAQNQFVAVGGVSTPTNRGFIVTSPDGVTWTTRRTNVPALLVSVAGNANGFVAVGGRTSSRSPTGVTLTDATDAGIGGRNAVAANANLFVSTAVTTGINEGSTFYSSSDGAVWATNGTGLGLKAITYANNRFVTVGSANDPGFSPLGTKPAFYVSVNGTNWVSRSRPLSSLFANKPPTIAGVGYGNGRFVAMMSAIVQTTAITSTNGAEWSGTIIGSIPTGPGAIIYAGGQFVAVGGDADSDSSAISTSVTGTNWTYQFPPGPGALRAVTHNGSLYVAVGRITSGDRPVFTSADGVNWDSQSASAGISNDLFGITFGGDAFVAVGGKGTVARSTDGVSWTQQSIVSSNHLRAVLFTNSQFVAVGDAGNIFTSPNGTTWTRRTSGTTLDLKTVLFFNNRYIAAGGAGTLLTSTDAISWSAADCAGDGNVTSAATGGGVMVLGGENLFTSSSTNGLDWILRDPGNFPADPLFRDVLAMDDRVLACGATFVTKSTTGRTWSYSPTTGFTAGNGVAYANGILVAVGTEELGQATRISYSTNRAESWTDLSLGTLGQLYGITYGNGLFVTCGDRPSGTNAPILTSTNGINWTFRNSGLPAPLWDVTFGNGLFVAVGTSGGVRSTDGINWTTNAGSFGETVAFGGGKFVAAGTSILLSSNGTNWSTVLSGVNILAVRYGFGTFVAAGPSGTILTSTNGSNWVNRFVRTQQKFNAVNFVNDSAFVVGFGATIYQSDFLTNTPARIVQGPQSRTVLDGANAIFTASVTGRLPMTFQWQKNGVPISGATDIDLKLNTVAATDAGNYRVVVNNQFGSQTSSNATLTVAVVAAGVAPEVLYLFTNTSGSFTSSVNGATPAGYQWKRFSTLIDGATNSTLMFTNVQVDDAATFSVIVTLPFGQVTSTNEGFLAVLETLDQVQLVSVPFNAQVPTGGTATFMSIVQGPTPQSYQWMRGGTNIAGATNSSLVFTNAQVSDIGNYGLKVTYPQGAVTNEFVCMLDVYFAEPPVITGTKLLSPGLMQITFTGLVGRYYRIDYAAGLTPPIDWQLYNFVELTANPKDVPISIPINGVESNAFFRLTILPP